jgi:hypothetical protein
VQGNISACTRISRLGVCILLDWEGKKSDGEPACRSKNKNGQDLRKQKNSLVYKWWWKSETRNGMWQKIIKAKYLRKKPVANVKTRMSEPPCWKALLKSK